MLAQILAFLSGHPFIFPFLFALSEAIGMLPGVKASGVFQAIQNGLKWIMTKLPGA